MSDHARSRQIRPLVIAVAVAILLLAIAYASSVSSKATYLTQRNHRILANLGTGVESRINHFAGIFDRVRDLWREGERVSLDSFDIACLPPSEAGSANVPATPIRKPDPSARLPQPEIVNAGGTLELVQRGPEESEMRARPNAACLLGWLGESDVFDHVALLDGSGHSIYQVGRSGAKFREVPAREEPEEGQQSVRMPWEDGFNEPEIDLAGSTYRVYSYPLTLEFLEREPGGEDDLRRAQWDLVGLVRTDRLWAETLRLHSSLVSALVYALFLAAFSWPFVRLWALGPSERLRPRLAALTCFAMVAATGLLTVATGNLVGYRGLQADVSGELKDTATEISDAFESELRDALVTAQALEGKLASQALKACQTEATHTMLGNLLDGESDLRYRHLEMVFWMDPRGNQCFKWSVQPRPTPLLPVSDRPYFRNVRAGALSSLPGAEGPRFTLETVHSRNSGTNLAILGFPASTGSGETPVAGAVALALRFPSLDRPLLPPGRHLAVIDPTGQVLFHSRPERAGFENFLRETEDAPELRAILFASTERNLVAPYWGRDRQMFVSALKGVPWRLVVYQDKDLLRNLNLEVIATTLALFALLLLLLGLCAAVLLAIGRGRSGAMLDGRHAGRLLRAACVFAAVAAALGLTLLRFPSQLLAVPALVLPAAALGLAAATLVHGGRGPRLQQAVGMTLGLLGIAGFTVWVRAAGASPTVKVLLTCFLGAAFLLAAISRDCPVGTRRLHTLSLASLGAAALTALAVLPALGFLLAVQEERLDREVRRGQLELTRALERRAERTRVAARDVPGLGVHLRDLLCDDRDVHYGAYFTTRYSLYAPDGGPESVPCRKDLALLMGAGDRPTTARAITGSRLPVSVAAEVALYLPANDHLVQSLLLADNHTALPAERRWRRTKRDLRLDLTDSPGGRGWGAVISTVPAVGPELDVAIVLAGLGALLLVALSLWLLDRRLLIVGRTAAPPACLEELRTGAFQRLLVVYPPGSDLTEVEPNSDLRLDLNAGGGAEALSKLLTRTATLEDGALVCVVGMEAAMNAPDLQEALRKAVDQLGSQTRLRVLLLSAADPMAVLGSGGTGPAGNEARGAGPRRGSVERFRIEWCPDPACRRSIRRDSFEERLTAAAGPPASPRRGARGLIDRRIARRRLAILREECRSTQVLQDLGLALVRRPDFSRLDPDRIPDLVKRGAADHYRDIWEALSEIQRHVLAQVVGGAMVNPARREAAERLAAWNLIVPRPMLRPMNRSFARFVAEVHDPAELRRWEEAGGSPLWQELRLPLAMLFMALAAFLVITQREVFDVALAVVSAAAAGIPALLRMVDGARKWIGDRMSRGAAGA